MATYASLKYDFGTQITGAIPTAAIADDAITLAKMDSGTDGNIITYDASGNPAAVATGSDGQVLTSAGSGQPAAMEDAGGFDVTSITGATALAAQPAATDEVVFSDAGSLKRLDISHIQNTPAFAAYADAEQTITDSNYTKITFGTEVYDTDGTFASSRFTPAVAGKYLISCTMSGRQSQGNVTFSNCMTTIYKNGSIYSSGHLFGEGVSKFSSFSVSHSDIVDLDADDYVEIYGYGAVSTESPRVVAATTVSSKALGHATTFSGFRITGV